MTDQRFTVLFVGAGPGDPDLITVKGRDALRQADRVIYTGSLVPEALLTHCRPDARTLDSASLDLAAIVNAMSAGYANGERVVRLHTGDPSLYGAIHEQMTLLRKQHIPYAVIPGVTAAFAAAAALGMEFTLPGQTQTLILTRIAGRTPVPERESLIALAAHGASLVLYLSMGQAPEIARVLSDTYGSSAACVIAEKVGHPDEAFYQTTVAELPRLAADKQIVRHALILIGPCVTQLKKPADAQSLLYDAGFSHLYRTGIAEPGKKQP
ncbi:MAG: precorrin-4 C(11)-methyltransferase [Deltaproteobacteria bacterium]|nr:MAG: precorrin-4 C(11)-methyltransferase [Deltaproteobacteria bacterium]